MNIDWKQIDHNSFVHLVGDLLRRLGFVDIDHQGDGPDGGIDIFATELVPFTIQGRVPFRWAVQCKFSSDPSDKSVNDREVRDVSGVLLSERYAEKRPKGYMLVTNRSIVQNVVERLRGIEGAMQFRTARVDGTQLTKLLEDQELLRDTYFGDAPRIPLVAQDFYRRVRNEVSKLSDEHRKSMNEMATACANGPNVFTTHHFGPEAVDAMLATGLVVLVNGGLGVAFPENLMAEAVKVAISHHTSISDELARRGII